MKLVRLIYNVEISEAWTDLMLVFVYYFKMQINKNVWLNNETH